MGSVDDEMLSWMNSDEYQEMMEQQELEEEQWWREHPESPLNKGKYRIHIANKYMLYIEFMEKSYLFRFKADGHEYLFKNLHISLKEKVEA
ncbi:hypothetical protein WBG78_05010 [Chryseolinea sp. T2]|uniref:hypothetical protein n=1 Tax=Chryseolinea sp. T2 TaxID=3129255 RepID=UPI0030780075